MKDIAASIDLGSHTARLLIAERSPSSPWGWMPLARRRVYIRLAADSMTESAMGIESHGAARALKALNDFSRLITESNVGRIRAVATGIIRTAAYGERFLDYLTQQSGIPISLISGEREAFLSGRGACGVLNIQEDVLVFDLGGGTTEFLRKLREETEGVSVSLGAAVFTRRFIRSDPPGAGELEAVSREVSRHLHSVAPSITGIPLVVGTGGSIAALGAMVHGIATDEIGPERLNGRLLHLSGIEACLEQMKTLTTAERVSRLGLDQGRADVIVAGAIIIAGILKFLEKSELIISMSDLLEGLLIDN